MDPPLPGLMIDLSVSSEFAMEEKRKVVYELANMPTYASEVLQSWTRKDLIEIVCVEMGKERKYTGLAKQKIIELLLELVAEKMSVELAEEMDTGLNPPSKSMATSKRQRKVDNPSRLPIGMSMDVNNTQRYCQNVACKATLKPDCVFCKRCSCCICYRYDDNKDPSLWLFCDSDDLSEGNPCGVSCHLDCALKNEKTGMVKSRRSLDGSFYCPSCGKINDLLLCLRKQLTIAKDARRVDILCHRISLSHKLLHGTERYKKLMEFINMAMRKLEKELGPINGPATTMGRGIVNRLSSGAEIQKLCLHAVDCLDSIHNNRHQSSLKSKTVTELPGRCIPTHDAIESFSPLSASIRFECITSTSLSIVLESKDGHAIPEEVTGFDVWFRRADSVGYPEEPTFKLIRPNLRFVASELNPATKYMFKIIAINNDKELGKWEAEVSIDTIPEDAISKLPMQDEPAVSMSPKTNSSDLSNPSDGDESNNNEIYPDLNKLPGDYEEPPDIEKTLNLKETSHHKKTGIGAVVSGEEVIQASGEAPGLSISALDEQRLHSVIQAGVHTNPSCMADQSQASHSQKFVDSNLPHQNSMSIIPYGNSESTPPATPSKLKPCKDGMGRLSKLRSDSSSRERWQWKPVKDPTAGNLSRKRSVENDAGSVNKRGSEGDYEYCVKVVRWLECMGHIETNFRVKFLTWFSLRATPQERKVVSVFVDALKDDPPSLAGQLVDTFSEGINQKRQPEAPGRGLCTRLWH